MNQQSLRTLSLLLILLAVGSAPSARAQEATADLTVLGMLSGCWRGEFGGGAAIEEFYTAADGGLMLGTTRYLRESEVVQFEFTQVAADGDRVVLTPYPGGRASEHGFVLTSFDGTTAIFEAPEHDYPKRIVYRKDSDDGRTASIDGGAGDPQPRAWTMARVECAR